MEDTATRHTGYMLFTSSPHPCTHSWMNQDIVPGIYPRAYNGRTHVAFLGTLSPSVRLRRAFWKGGSKRNQGYPRDRSSSSPKQGSKRRSGIGAEVSRRIAISRPPVISSLSPWSIHPVEFSDQVQSGLRDVPHRHLYLFLSVQSGSDAREKLLIDQSQTIIIQSVWFGNCIVPRRCGVKRARGGKAERSRGT